MAAGAIYSGYSAAVANSAFVDTAPINPAEAVIHNIYHGGTIELYWYDGVHTMLFDSQSGPGVYDFHAFHVNSSLRIYIKNISGAAIDIGWDGMYTA